MASFGSCTSCATCAPCAPQGSISRCRGNSRRGPCSSSKVPYTFERLSGAQHGGSSACGDRRGSLHLHALELSQTLLTCGCKCIRLCFYSTDLQEGFLGKEWTGIPDELTRLYGELRAPMRRNAEGCSEGLNWPLCL